MKSASSSSVLVFILILAVGFGIASALRGTTPGGPSIAAIVVAFLLARSGRRRSRSPTNGTRRSSMRALVLVCVRAAAVFLRRFPDAFLPETPYVVFTHHGEGDTVNEDVYRNER